MKKYKHHAASATVRSICEGVAEVVFCGPLTTPAFRALRECAIKEVGPHRAAVIRIDSALLAMGEIRPRSPTEHPPGRAGAALVVREDQYDAAWAYAALAAEFGITICVFLSSSEHSMALALDWARRQAALAGFAG